MSHFIIISEEMGGLIDFLLVLKPSIKSTKSDIGILAYNPILHSYSSAVFRYEMEINEKAINVVTEAYKQGLRVM